MSTTRRQILAGLAAVAPGLALAEAPVQSPRPLSRSSDLPRTRPRARIDTIDLVRQAGLDGLVSIALYDPATGEMLDSIAPDVQMPPASVTKSVTALYALDALGADHRFATRVLADGPIIDGVLEGDLILAGGGDPTLDTDRLAALADAVAATGLTEVRGDFLVWGGALNGVDEIDEGQLDHLGYNPSVSGLNLNYNRVHFEWKRAGDSYDIALDARSETLRPAVKTARMRVVERKAPVYSYRDAGGVDEWSVARGALGTGGSRWLPVRYPALYAGDVFQTLATSSGIKLPRPTSAPGQPDGTELARVESDGLGAVMQQMLRFSTNLTAEVAGLAATTALSGQRRGLRTSALGMTRWVEEQAGVSATFVDHSGLGDASRISAAGMTGLMTSPGMTARLRPILKRIRMLDAEGRPIDNHPAIVRAKTGTLNFVSTLAGYVTTASGRDLSFAIFSGDLDARARSKQRPEERPAGSADFSRRARRLQQRLLQHWSAQY